MDSSFSNCFYSSLPLDNNACLYRLSPASFDLALPLGPLPTLGLNNYYPVSGSKSSFVKLLEFSIHILDLSLLLVILWLNF